MGNFDTIYINKNNIQKKVGNRYIELLEQYRDKYFSQNIFYRDEIVDKNYFEFQTKELLENSSLSYKSFKIRNKNIYLYEDCKWILKEYNDDFFDEYINYKSAFTVYNSIHDYKNKKSWWLELLVVMDGSVVNEIDLLEIRRTHNPNFSYTY